MADLEAISVSVEKAKEEIAKAKGLLVPLNSLRQVESLILGLLSGLSGQLEYVQGKIGEIKERREKEKANQSKDPG